MPASLTGWRTTSLTRALGLRYPVIQGAFGGGLSTVELVAAVSEAGGLGSFGAHGLGPEEILQTAQAIRERTRGPFALNLWVPLPGEGAEPPRSDRYAAATALLEPYYRELGLEPPTLSALTESARPTFGRQLEAVLRARPPALSFIFGIPPAEALAECRRLGIVTIGTATNLPEAEALDAAAVDVIVASGLEAGGHRSSFLRPVSEALTLGALLPQVVDKVRQPVVAAGGIADGRGVVSALVYGAAGVQVGTAFLAAPESGASAAHRRALVEGPRATVLTRALTGRYARGLVSRLARELAPHEAEALDYPWQNALTVPLRRAAGSAGMLDLIPFWAGQNAPLVKQRSAAEMLAFLVEDTERVLTSP